MSERIVPPSIYDKDYFLKDNEGWREWETGLDKGIHPKFKRALELAGPLEGKRILDIGCGRGELLYYCVKEGAFALGLDYSAAAIEIARQTLSLLPPELRSGGSADVGDIGKYPIKGQFDTIFMIEIAEHMHDWQLIDAFRIIKSLLKPGGRLIIMTPNYYYEKMLSPIKRALNIPMNLVKWISRLARGKYGPGTVGKSFSKIFKIAVDRGELNKAMHVNVTTPGTLKKLLADLDARIWCEDHSVNIVSILTRRWWGREVIAVAVKR